MFGDWNKVDKIGLTVILLIAGTLRCFNINDGLMHDELSALFRLNFDSFSTLIDGGVRGDGHPPGTQVFLYYWTSIFGTSNISLRAPFIAINLLSITLSYYLAKRWFHTGVALMTAILLATLQFSVMNGQICRPYAFGQFFILLQFTALTRSLTVPIIAKKEGWEPFDKLSTILYLVGGIGACYSHHFSLLTGVVVGGLGFMLIPIERYRYYLSLNLLVALCYLPIIGITMGQMNLGGLNWLSVPKWHFLISHFQYLFHFDLVAYAVPGVLLVIGLPQFIQKPHRRIRIIMLLAFVIPYLIIHLYSITSAPVLQHSALYFGLPFLLILLSSGIPPHKKLNIGLTTGAALLLCFSLIFNRNHLKHMRLQPFQSVANYYTDIQQKFENTYLLSGDNTEYLNHYLTEAQQENHFSLYEYDAGPSQFRTLVQNLHSDHIAVSNIPLHFHGIVQETFPHYLYERSGYNFTIEVYSKTKPQQNKTKRTAASLTNTPAKWNRPAPAFDKQYGPEFTSRLLDITPYHFDVIDISATVQAPKDHIGLIVAELQEGENQVVWRSSSFYDFNQLPDTTTNLHLSLRLNDYFKSDLPEDATLKVYYWNKSWSKVNLTSFEVSVRKGNDMIYGLYEAR